MTDRGDAVDAEGAEIVAHLAPGDQRPDLAPEPQAERPHVARRAAARFVAVVERQHVALSTARSIRSIAGAVGVAHHPHRRMDLGAGDAVLLAVGQHRADLDQRLFGGPGHRRAAKGAHHAGAGDQRHDLVTREHQRRKVEAFPHQVADTRLAVDRHAGRLQVGNVAVDRPLGNLEPLAELLRGDQAAAAKMLDDLEKTVCAPHRSALQALPRRRCAATKSAPKLRRPVVGVIASSTRQNGVIS